MRRLDRSSPMGYGSDAPLTLQAAARRSTGRPPVASNSSAVKDTEMPPLTFPESVLRKCRIHHLSTLSELYSSSAPLPYHKSLESRGSAMLPYHKILESQGSAIALKPHRLRHQCSFSTHRLALKSVSFPYRNEFFLGGGKNTYLSIVFSLS